MPYKKKADTTSKYSSTDQVAESAYKITNFRLDEDLSEHNLSRSSEAYLATGPQWTVIVWDHRSSRLRLIDHVVSECGARSLLLEGLTDIDRAQHSFSCCAAVVALGTYSTEDTLGLEIIRRLKNAGFTVISHELGSNSWALGVRCRALLAGASCVLDSGKTEFALELKHKLTGLLEQRMRERVEKKQIRDLMNTFGIVGESEAMFSTFRHILRISPLSDIAVLITGESGTGKELIARAIHQLDLRRCKGPFVAVNCGAISPGLAESELFGHRRGAFTGADQDRKGLVRSAHGGVLFLDEIGELSSDLQAKLLRVLQENRVLSVGDDREVCVNFRVIAATNRDLEQMVEQREFRADLFHRLNVLSTHICPLRERAADLKPLIEHFLSKYRAVATSRTYSMDRDFVEALIRLQLPGNVRQLENLVRRVLVNKMDDTPLSLSDLPAEIWQQLCAQGEKNAVQANLCCKDSKLSDPNLQISPIEFLFHLITLLESNEWNLLRSLDYCERLLLEAALHHAHGNHSQAARLLGITPRSVYNKLKKHHLDQ
jgi:transcriptional regulator with PAS, ATPase and Fis domain